MAARSCPMPEGCAALGHGAIGMSYDPFQRPEASEWLQMDEAARIARVIEHHEKARIRLPNPRMHAVMHVIVENQLAEGYLAAYRALNRLLEEGLDRHEAIHAIAWVVSKEMSSVLTSEGSQNFDRTAYDQALGSLTAESWRRDAG